MLDLIIKMAIALFSPQSLAYLLLVYAIGFVALPLSHKLFYRSQLVWFSASKILGLSLFNYAMWVLGHNAFGWSLSNVPGDSGIAKKTLLLLFGNGMGLFPYSGWALWTLMLVSTLASIWWGYRRFGREILQRFKAQKRSVLIAEMIFLIAFAFGLALRMHAPDIKDQEKFMDMAFLNSLSSNSILPPADPWRYDLPINYYYGGYMQMATMAKMTATRPEIAYNISVGIILGLSCLLAFALAFELTRKARWALLAVCAVMLMSNLDVAIQNWDYLRNTIPDKTFSIDWWRPSRVISDGPKPTEQADTINEFPFFSIYHADLHPHMMAIPYVLLFLCFAFDFVGRKGIGFQSFGSGGMRWLRLLLLSWSLGTLAFVNGFDFITFVFVFGAFALAREWGKGSRPIRMLLHFGLVWFAVVMLSVLLFAPFFANYHAPVAATSPLTYNSSIPYTQYLKDYIRNGLPFGFVDFRSGMGEFLIMWGIQLTALGLYLSTSIRRIALRLNPSMRLIIAPAFFLSFGLFLFWWRSGPACLLPFLFLWIMASYLTQRKTPVRKFVFACMIMSILILLACEQFYIRDSYGKNLQRMNTLFKFYYPVWILLGLLVPYCLREVTRNWAWPKARRLVLLSIAFFLIVWGMEYCVWITRERIRKYNESAFGPPTLNGMRYMEQQHPGDFGGILYLRENARSLISEAEQKTAKVPVILEAVGGSYTYHARVATYSGCRSVLGWPGHESVWRGPWPSEIENDVKTIYSTTDIELAKRLLLKYNVDFVFIGELERLAYPNGLEKFKEAFPQIYSRDGVEIYNIND